MRFNSNDSRTPSERIDGELLRRLIEQNNAMPGAARGPRRNGRGVSEDGPSMPWPSAGDRGESGMPARNESGNGGNGSGGNGSGSCGCGCGCSCGNNGNGMNGNGDDTVSWGLYGYPLAMVYAPVQCFGELYEPDKGLSQGTIFRQLNLPFTGKGGCRQ